MSDYTERFVDYLSNNNLPDILGEMPADTAGTSFTDRFIARNCYKEIGSETEELFKIHLNIKSQEVYNLYCDKIKQYYIKFDELLSRKQRLNDETELAAGIIITDTRTPNLSVNETYNPDTTETNTRVPNITKEETRNDFINPISPQSDVSNSKDITTNKETGTETSTYKRNGSDKSTTTTSGTDKNERVRSGKDITTKNYDHILFNFKSNTEMMKELFELKNIYEEALAYMDTLFMVLL